MAVEALRPVSISVGPRQKHQEIADHFPGELNGRVLDVGGFQNNPFLQEVLPAGVTPYSLNFIPETHGRIPDIGGTGLRLPFQDDSIKLSTAIEVIEHVNGWQREQFVREMLRVSEWGSLLCLPFDSPTNVSNEYNLVTGMENRGLQPKRSTLEHRLKGLPTLGDLVSIGRNMRVPFALYPSTNANILFQSLYDQVLALTLCPKNLKLGTKIAKEIADSAEERLIEAQKPSWEEAYRTIMVLQKKQQGEVITDENRLFLSTNETMAYQAAFNQAGWTQIENGDVFRFYKENPLRGSNIVVEGPEGSGKTSLVRELVKRMKNWGYDIAVQTDHGLRQRIRDMEKKMNRVISDPERAEFFAFAMIESAVAGNAFSLLGPCNISINDRGIESVRMHHGLHCPKNVTIPYLLGETGFGDKKPLNIPPDLTIVLWVPDEEHNYYLMQKDGDLVNKTKGPSALAFQRRFYRDLALRGGSDFTGRIAWIENPGKEGSFETVVEQAMAAIESYCKIPLSR